jgi:hypothetical protein
MKRNIAYMRCCGDVIIPEHGIATTNLQALEWSNVQKSGKVTISDIASAASVFGQTCPATPTATLACYFAHPLYSSNPATSSVDIGDIATVASYFDHGISAPFLGTSTGFLTATPSALTGYSPNLDPYGLGSEYLQGYGDHIHKVPIPGPTPPAPTALGYDCATDGGTVSFDPLSRDAAVSGDSLHNTPLVQYTGTNNLSTVCGLPLGGGDMWIHYSDGTIVFEEFVNPS